MFFSILVCTYENMFPALTYCIWTCCIFCADLSRFSCAGPKRVARSWCSLHPSVIPPPWAWWCVTAWQQTLLRLWASGAEQRENVSEVLEALAERAAEHPEVRRHLEQQTSLNAATAESEVQMKGTNATHMLGHKEAIFVFLHREHYSCCSRPREKLWERKETCFWHKHSPSASSKTSCFYPFLSYISFFLILFWRPVRGAA